MKGTHVVTALLVIIAIGFGALIYIKRNATRTILPPILNLETGQMLLVPGGPFQGGQASTQTEVAAFYVDKTEVTNAAYGAFCKATNRLLPGGFMANQPNLPIVNVTIADAIAFAKWAGKRLPTASEWEKAARGTEGKPWPWGQALDPKLANVNDNTSLTEHKLIPVNSMLASASPYGALQMVGNAAEYVSDTIVPSTDTIARFSNLLQPPPSAEEPWQEVKGGSFARPLETATPWQSMPIPARFAAHDIGFRCVKDAPQ